MKRIQISLLLLTGLLATFFSIALNANDTRIYQIEMVVFEHIYSNSTGEATSRVESESQFPRLSEFSPANKENLALAEEAKRIRGSRNFRYIGHAAWVQNGLDKESAGSVSLNSWLNDNSIDATATVYLNRYLHVDLKMNKDGHAMHQRRRMRSKELHYIDHPQFGVLIEITPVIQ